MENAGGCGPDWGDAWVCAPDIGGVVISNTQEHAEQHGSARAAATSGSVGLSQAACPSTTKSTLPGSGRLQRTVFSSSCFVVANEVMIATGI